MKNKGLILKSIDYKETSKIVYLYTPLGKQSIKVIGANNPKKGLLGFITTGNLVSFVATDNDFPNLLEYNLEESIFSITSSIDSLEALKKILDVLNYIPDDINHQSTYSFIEKTIKDLIKSNPKKVLAVYLIKMLYVFGVSPSLKACSICGNTNPVAFKISDGGGVCEYCRPGIKNKDIYKLWYEYYYDKKDISEYSATDYDILLNSIYKYYATHVHINLK